MTISTTAQVKFLVYPLRALERLINLVTRMESKATTVGSKGQWTCMGLNLYQDGQRLGYRKATLITLKNQ